MASPRRSGVQVIPPQHLHAAGRRPGPTGSSPTMTWRTAGVQGSRPHHLGQPRAAHGGAATTADRASPACRLGHSSHSQCHSQCSSSTDAGPVSEGCVIASRDGSSALPRAREAYPGHRAVRRDPPSPPRRRPRSMWRPRSRITSPTRGPREIVTSMYRSPSSPASASTTMTSYVTVRKHLHEKNPCKRRVSCPYAHVRRSSHAFASSLITTQLSSCNLARDPRASTMRQQRKCLTLTSKPSLIDGIPLHGGGRRVNKSGLIDAISNTTSLTKRETEDAVNALVHAVVSEVRAGRRVSVVGFGSFNPTQRGARMGRNPQTGAPVRIAASRGVRFSASSTLKDIVNGKAPLPALKTSPAPSRKAADTYRPEGAQESGQEIDRRRQFERTPATTPPGGPSARSSGVLRPQGPRSVLRRGKQRSDRPTRPYGGLRRTDRRSAPRRGKQRSDRPRRP